MAEEASEQLEIEEKTEKHWNIQEDMHDKESQFNMKPDIKETNESDW